MKRKQFSAMVKRIIGARQKWRCCTCEELLPAGYHIDHRVPLHKGGTNADSNLQAICAACHNEKSYLEQYESYKARQRKKIKKKECKPESIEYCSRCNQYVSIYFVHSCPKDDV